VGVEIPISMRSVSSALRGELGASCYLVQCVWPLCRSRGIRGKKSAPRVGWEVLVKSHRSAHGRFTECPGQRLSADNLGYDMLNFILPGRLLLYLTLPFLCFELGK
jgi:hypothetical protein